MDKKETISFELPLMIEVNDYHEITLMEDMINSLKPSKKVISTEIGFDNGIYYGVIHLDTDEHRDHVNQMIEDFEIMV